MRVENHVSGHLWLVLVLFGVLTLVAACAAPAASPTVAPTKPATAPAAGTTPIAGSTALPAGPAAGAADIEAGKTVFTANCNSCHPNGGRGVGPEIKGKPVDLVKKVVRSGQGTGMPSFTADKISDAQLNQLAAYVASLK